MGDQALTARQQAIHDFIRDYTTENGYPPTMREIGTQFGIRSTNGVNDHLKALEQKGVLKRGDLKSRALRLIDGPTAAAVATAAAAAVAASPATAPDDSLEIPLLGRVAAGQPLLATQSGDETVRIDRALLGGRAQGQLFGLRVRGDSMIGAGIFDGDVVFVRRQDIASDGDVVVALLGDEATVKRLSRGPNHVRLISENPAIAPIVVGADRLADLRILGVVIAVFRRL